MATKALPAARNERLRELVRELLAKIGGNQSDLARAMKLQPGQISEFISGRKGAGPSLLTAIATYTGKSLDELMTGATVAPAQPGASDTPADRARAAAVALGFHPESIERGMAKAEEGDTAWQLLTYIQGVDSKRPVGDLYGSPTVKPFAKPDPTLKDKMPALADAPPAKQKAVK